MTIPSSVSAVGAGAFGGCNIAHVNVSSWGHYWMMHDSEGSSSYGDHTLYFVSPGSSGKTHVIGDDTGFGVAAKNDGDVKKVWCVVTTPSGNQHKMPLKKGNDGNWHFVVGSDWEEGGDLNVGSFVYSDAAGNETQILASGTISACILTYSDNGDGTCTVTGALGRAADLVVPAEVDGLRVTAIAGHAFEGAGWIESLKLPEGLLSIGEYAFAGCASMRSASFPSTLSSMEWRAFQECASLGSVEIPGSLGLVPTCAFTDCTALRSVVIGEGVLEIGASAFAICPSLADVTLPSTLLSVGGDAFQGCASLASVQLPEGLVSIDIEAFVDCTSLASVGLPSTLRGVGRDAFVRIAEDSVIYAPTWELFFKLDGNAEYLSTDRTRVVYNGPAVVCGSSLTLEGQIGVNLYVAIPDTLRNAEGAYASIDLPGTTIKIPLAYASLTSAAFEDGPGVPVYVFTSTLYAKNMADNLTFRICGPDGEQLPVVNRTNLSLEEAAHTYSVRSYHESAQQDGGQVAVLTEAMVSYGAAAQCYFGYGTDDLAGDPDAASQVVLDDLASYQSAGLVGKVAGISLVGSTLTLEEATTVTHYFQVAGGHSINDYEFTVNGQSVTPTKNGGYWQVKVENIPAQNLEDFHEVMVTRSGKQTATLRYAALSYAYSVLASQQERNLQALCKALYVYNMQANLYFDNRA